MSAKPRPAASGSTRRSSTCARWCRWTPTRSAVGRSTGRCVIVARGDAIRRFRRRTLGDRPGTMLLEPRRRRSCASRAGIRRIRTRSNGNTSRARRASRSALKAVHGGRMSRYVFKLPDLGEGTVDGRNRRMEGQGRRHGQGRPDHRRGHDRQGDGRVAGAGQRPRGCRCTGAARRHGRGRRRTDRVRDRCRRAGWRAPAQPPAGAGSAGAPLRRRNRRTAPREPNGLPARRPASCASPATRRKARARRRRSARVAAAGPGGRISAQVLDGRSRAKTHRRSRALGARRESRSDIEEIKVIGVRRVIAQRMSAAKRNIPHFAYVEEVDVTELESLRQHLNRAAERRTVLTYLPFLVAALVRVLEIFPQCNARPRRRTQRDPTPPRACTSASQRRRLTD